MEWIAIYGTLHLTNENFEKGFSDGFDVGNKSSFDIDSILHFAVTWHAERCYYSLSTYQSISSSRVALYSNLKKM